jgi:aerobic C4-dicarboxylate transport protein
LLYFEVVTTLALLIGVVVAAVVRPGDGVAVGKLSTDKVGEFHQAGGRILVGPLLGR